MSKIKFHNISCAIDLSFWHVLAKKKLEELKLNDDFVKLTGYYSPSNNLDLPPVFRVVSDSFNPDLAVPANSVKLSGLLKIYNTREEFKSIDLKSVLQHSGEMISSCNVACFVLLVYADLKDFVFNYWAGFPVFNFAPLDYVELDTGCLDLSGIQKQLSDMVKNARLKPVLGILKSDDADGASLDLTEDWVHCETIAFIDPAPFPDYPSAVLRNILGLLSSVEPKARRFLSIKDSISGDPAHFTLNRSRFYLITPPTVLKEFVGWEGSNSGHITSKIIDLRSQLDPVSLASSAVNLNLKLMRWRMMPDLDLDAISNARCLILGAGTLGSQIARNLMGWGVKSITFIDSSRVSHSNPVRQSLYEFEDASLREFKAIKAAEKLKKIYPGIESKGLCISIPMPGHSIKTTESESRAGFEVLEREIQENDVIFLLTDSRESRWLPTLMSASYDKICFAVALGFDSFLVVRHGSRASEDRLGCYFCNDVVGPRNSLTDRTLDQQCTVTRPGLSYQASAVAVELLVGLLQHPQKHRAAHGLSTPLGILPHQIRGNFSSFSIAQYSSSAFSRCTACSDVVVQRFKQEGFEFIKSACNDPEFLEEVCGLKELANVNEDDLIEIDDLDD